MIGKLIGRYRVVEKLGEGGMCDANPPVPEDLRRIVKRLLDNDPAGRHQSTDELIADLERRITTWPADTAQKTGPLPEAGGTTRPSIVRGVSIAAVGLN